jgi:hypothetical protein
MKDFATSTLFEYGVTMSFEISTADEILSIGLLTFTVTAAEKEIDKGPQSRLDITATAAS